jgi:chemotaxis signal transduction protein
MESYPAWLLQAAGDMTLAVAQHEMIEYLTDARSQRVPLANAHCEHLAVWRDRLVPVLDFARLFAGSKGASQRSMSVVAYQPSARQPLEYLGIWTDTAPSRITVSDDQACELPPAWRDERLQELALSCFAHEERTVPILNLANLARVSG